MALHDSQFHLTFLTRSTITFVIIVIILPSLYLISSPFLNNYLISETLLLLQTFVLLFLRLNHIPSDTLLLFNTSDTSTVDHLNHRLHRLNRRRRLSRALAYRSDNTTFTLLLSHFFSPFTNDVSIRVI